MSGQHSELAIELLAEPGTDDQELMELALRLRGELLDLDVEAVEPAIAGQAPAGAKGIELLALGGLIVRFAPDVLRGVVALVRSWADRQRMQNVKLTLDGDILEISGLRSVEQERLVDLWIARHASPG